MLSLRTSRCGAATRGNGPRRRRSPEVGRFSRSGPPADRCNLRIRRGPEMERSAGVPLSKTDVAERECQGGHRLLLRSLAVARSKLRASSRCRTARGSKPRTQKCAEAPPLELAAASRGNHPPCWARRFRCSPCRRRGGRVTGSGRARPCGGLRQASFPGSAEVCDGGTPGERIGTAGRSEALLRPRLSLIDSAVGEEAADRVA